MRPPRCGLRLMTRSFEFFVDVVVTGQVLGVDASCPPEQVTRVLGGYAENVNRRRTLMWRDYGAVEFFWNRPSARGPWQGTHLSVQVHRLWDEPTLLNDVVRRAYGDVTGRLPFDQLRLAVAEAGAHLVEPPRRSTSDVRVREYVNPERLVTVLVVTRDGKEDLGLEEGHVWSITCGNRVRGTQAPARQ